MYLCELCFDALTPHSTDAWDGLSTAVCDDCLAPPIELCDLCHEPRALGHKHDCREEEKSDWRTLPQMVRVPWQDEPLRFIPWFHPPIEEMARANAMLNTMRDAQLTFLVHAEDGDVAELERLCNMPGRVMLARQNAFPQWESQYLTSSPPEPLFPHTRLVRFAELLHLSPDQRSALALVGAEETCYIVGAIRAEFKHYQRLLSHWWGHSPVHYGRIAQPHDIHGRSRPLVFLTPMSHPPRWWMEIDLALRQCKAVRIELRDSVFV